MPYVIYIDTRENRNKKLEPFFEKSEWFQKKHPNTVVWKELHAGDIRMFDCEDGRLLRVIERKTADDLLGSENDRRKQEQLQRLIADRHTLDDGHELAYILEGEPSTFANRKWRKRGGALTNVNRICNELRSKHHVFVYQTENQAKTVRMLEKLMEMDLAANNPAHNIESTQALAKTGSSKAIAPEDFLRVSLSLIRPSLTTGPIEAIARKYDNSMIKLTYALLKDEKEATQKSSSSLGKRKRKQTLASLPYTTANAGKTQKISNKVADKIACLFLGHERNAEAGASH